MIESERVKNVIAEAKRSRLEARRNLKPVRRFSLARKALWAALSLVLLGIALPPFLVPVEGRVSSAFFFRFAPDKTLPTLEFHDAIDIAVPAGTPVRSIAWGVVESCGWDDAAGNFVRMRHPLGIHSFYAHLSSLLVRPGDLIVFPFFRRLGFSGSTGRSTGPHLHFAVRVGRIPLPPDMLLFFHRIRLAILGF